MSRRYNTKHTGRVRSHYPARLSARGLSKAPTMEDLDTLAKRQARRVVATCTLVGEHDKHVCNGQPYYVPSFLEDSADES